MEVNTERMKKHLKRVNLFGRRMGYCGEMRMDRDEASMAYDDGYLAGYWKGFERGRVAGAELKKP